jgi:hypothetical protein
MAKYDQAYDFFLQQVLPKLQPSIVPLYKVNPVAGRYPVFVGSSVYCQFGPFVMLFTAGHVLRHILPDHAIYPQPLPTPVEEPRGGRIPLLRSLVEMRAVPYERYVLPTNKTDDSGIIVLKSNLQFWTPLPAEGFSQFDEREEYQHVMVGYPASSTRGSIRSNQRIEIKGYLTNAAPAGEYSNVQADPTRQLVLLFKKQKVYGKNRLRVTFPNPYGMSGGAVFQFHEKSPRVQSLVGIMTEWQGRAIVATRVEAFTSKFHIERIDGGSIQGSPGKGGDARFQDAAK